jgi:hypothetical protein
MRDLYVACVNLIDREDRYRHMQSQFARLSLPVAWHRNARHPTSGRVGCFEAHLGVYGAALRAGAPWALIFEDDVEFTEHAAASMSKLLGLLGVAPATWMQISVHDTGGVYAFDHLSERLPPYLRRECFVFARAYAISSEAMRLMLEQGVTREHVDMALARCLWGRTYRFRPEVALTTDTPFDSDNDSWGHSDLLRIAQTHTSLPSKILQALQVVLPDVVGHGLAEHLAWVLVHHDDDQARW